MAEALFEEIHRSDDQELRGVREGFVALGFALGRVRAYQVRSFLDLAREPSFGVGQGQWRATDTLAGPVTVLVSITARRSP